MPHDHVDLHFPFGPDHLESTIFKTTGKISLVIQSMLFRKIVDFWLVISQNSKQIIDCFLNFKQATECQLQCKKRTYSESYFTRIRTCTTYIARGGSSGALYHSATALDYFNCSRFLIIILPDRRRIRHIRKIVLSSTFLGKIQLGRLEQYLCDPLELVSRRITPDIGIPASEKFFQPKQGKQKKQELH